MGLQAKESLDAAQQGAIRWGCEQGAIVDYLSEVDECLFGAERAFPRVSFERVVSPGRVPKGLISDPKLVDKIQFFRQRA
ncbi:hypothetical protein, partial [Achromobacter sp. GbtcB20]|uniref:hypothetical protein n=1 Tax=Achromobacter sp. GbtcB20 TaxID=2824765 RepID=UPI001C2F1700